MTTRHERRATHSRRLEAMAVGTAALLTFLLCQLAPDGRTDAEGAGPPGAVPDAPATGRTADLGNRPDSADRRPALHS
ncbi:hypothetical protein [Streptomyces oceani]|uniref:Uncharacterized protein n=1 Tax=Streptomyces oceani TaxID=1075402 RepID=A0A1E7JXI9_9ACTN|nr:hypothetical protein [Streptomyces oceani]OEU96328.1 hypothetical protein AN216_20900 [Streptomyces oceani]